MKTNTLYLGIDVSKATLHLASPGKFLKVFNNNPEGHRLLIAYIRKLKPKGVVLEASGGYERMASEAMQDAGIPVTIAQPACVRYFAKSIKVLAKTDKIDAKVIARFGVATQPEPTPKTPENARKVRVLCDRRQQIVEDRVRETNRLEACADIAIAKAIRASIDHLEQTEQALDVQIKELIEADSLLKQKAEVMMQLKGVGPKTAIALLAHFHELGSLTRQQIAALAGLAPHPQESGKWNGKRRIYGGRATARKAMYMAAKSAARWCPVISVFYNRLREKGKPYNVALIACARKMLIRLNTLLKQMNQENHDPNGTISA